MIETTLILLLIHYLGLYLFKNKQTTLNCGLFGWAGNTPKNFNKDKFDKLGILNIERGRSSCGISFDGDIQIGIDSNKLYCDFIIDREIKPTRFPVVIGHTRQSSVGAVNAYNAHPFGFGDNNNDFVFIGAHNGTLKNHRLLAKKYEIEESVENVFNDKNNVEIITNRFKIDSEILLEIIYKHKNFKVLSEYVGGAALAFTDTTTPNILYLFKGKSKEYESSIDEIVERPLFVYIENQNSMYFSSLEDSLKTIGGNNKYIFNIEANVIYKITNGDFKNAELIKISRANSVQNETFVNKIFKNSNINYGYGYKDWDNFDNFENNGFGTALLDTKKEEMEEKSNTTIILPLLIEEKKEINIYNEKLLNNQDFYLGVPYFNKLRWYRNGQLITGIYVWIKNHGYYKLADNEKKANEEFYKILDKSFDGKYFNSCVKSYENFDLIPFKSNEALTPCFFYFVEGVQIKTYLDYAFIYNKHSILKSNKYLDYIELSQISTHPIINLNFKNKSIHEQNVLKNGFSYTGTFTLLGAEKLYTFQKGMFKDSEKISDQLTFNKDYYSKKKEIKLSKEIELFDNFEEILEQNDDQLINEMIEQEEEINQIIKDMCEEDFTESIKDYQTIKTKLFKYSENPLAIKLISFVDNTMGEIKKFIN